MPEAEFVIRHVDDEPWSTGELHGLPDGPQRRLYRRDEEAGEMVLLIKFPPGYVEPRHIHESEHWGVIVDGEMHVDGHVLKRGDHLHAPANVLHGPLHYPKGCTLYSTLRGPSAVHVWQPDDNKPPAT